MAYLRLLWIYYDTEKPLIDDPELLAFQIGADEKDVRLILTHYFCIANGMRTHKRCDEELFKYQGKSENARNSANARWKIANAMRTHADGSEDANACERMRTHEIDASGDQKTGRKDANAMRTQCERNANEPKNDANQEPITNNQISKPSSSNPVGFAEFWAAYPKKVGKAATIKNFAAAKITADQLPSLMAALEIQKRSDGWTKDGGKFILDPERWIKNRRWEDEVAGSSTAVSAGWTPPKIGDMRNHPIHGGREKFIGDRWVVAG
jgi:uncharacterized protein YdaU (DUF1376 family)